MKIDDLKGLSDGELKEKLKEILTSDESDFDWEYFKTEFSKIVGGSLYKQLFKRINCKFQTNDMSNINRILLNKNCLILILKDNRIKILKDNRTELKHRASADDLRNFISNFIEAVNIYFRKIKEYDDVWNDDIPKKKESKTELKINNELI